MLGIDERQLRGVRPEDVDQHVREIVQQMKAVGHLAGHGRSKACRFRVGFSPIAHKDLNPGMSLKPLGDSGGLPIGE